MKDEQIFTVLSTQDEMGNANAYPQTPINY